LRSRLAAAVTRWAFVQRLGRQSRKLAVPARAGPHRRGSSRLELSWAFGVPGAVMMFAQPTVAAGRVFISRQNGHVYALDQKSGGYYWDYRASGVVRTAITVADVGGRIVALFGDRRGYAYCVDAATGATIWKVTPDDEAGTLITGAPVLFENRLYVPISNNDGAGNPAYECCKGRGAVVALDAATVVVWTTYTTAQATPQGRNAIGTQLYGPSGASVWAAPTIDARNRVLYIGTGDNHSAPATGELCRKVGDDGVI
jgi:polyvinyl alcohol dehydrogenase (cytochrome)